MYVMSIFNFLKRNKISKQDHAVIDNFKKSVDILLNTPPPKSLTNKEYQEIRQSERNWLESHYDFSTVKSINDIPDKKNLPRPPGNSVTGDVYYYLHYKARCYADDLKYELAIACQKKSNALIKHRYGHYYGRKECYYLVKLYARAGLLDQAYREKGLIEQFYGIPAPGSRDAAYAQNMIKLAEKQGRDERDFAWLQKNIPSLCPKSKNGFCKMRKQNTKNYQILKELAAEAGKEI